jgi:hypothetical protein
MSSGGGLRKCHRAPQLSEFKIPNWVPEVHLEIGSDESFGISVVYSFIPFVCACDSLNIISVLFEGLIGA